MDISKWVPWNWFRKEEEASGKTVPVRKESGQGHGHEFYGPLAQFHRDIDRLFDHAFRGFGLAPFGFGSSLWPSGAGEILKPTLDLAATDGEYTLAVEIPGVDEKDIVLEMADDTLTIRGEKRQEKEAKEKDFYRVERSYGSFQRVLSLPEDADQNGVKATFRKGVLTVAIPRKSQPKPNVRRIEVIRA